MTSADNHRTSALTQTMTNTWLEPCLIITLITILLLSLLSVSKAQESTEQTVDNNNSTTPKYAISMYGDPAEKPDYNHLAYANQHAPQGGRISHGVVGTFDSLNPFILKSMRTTARGMWGAQFGHLYFQSLMMRSYDEPFTLYGLLAESVEMAPDRSWMEFTLNPAAKWHDGMPVTPEDVIFTYNLLEEKGRPPYSSRKKRIASIEKTGERNVLFKFNENSNREYPLIVAAFTPVLPKHAIDVESFGDSSLTPILGSGPYKIQKVDQGTKIVYKRFDDYWGKDLAVTKGFFNFDEVVIEYFQQQASLFEAFKKGLIDVYAEGDPTKWQRAYNFEAVNDGRIKKIGFSSGSPSNMSGFVFNTRRNIFSDTNIRQALIMAFDFETLNKNLFFGAYGRSQSFWQGSELASTGLPASAKENELLAKFPQAVQPEILDGTWGLPITNATGADRKILRKVISILQEAGLKRDGAVMLGLNGEPFTFEILTKNVTEEKIALSYSTTLAKLGINITVRSVDDAQYQKRLQTFEYDMIIANYSASLSPGIEQTWRWSTQASDTEGSFNFAGAKNPALDYLIKEMVAAQDRDDFIATVRAFDRVLLSGNYIIPLYYLKERLIAHWSHLGYPEKTALYGNQFPVWWHKDKQ